MAMDTLVSGAQDPFHLRILWSQTPYPLTYLPELLGAVLA